MAGPWEKYAPQGPWAKYATPTANPDGTYGEPPDGMFLDPRTGAMTSRELLANNVQPNRADAFTAGSLQGMSMGTSDEMMGLAGNAEGGDQMETLRREQARSIQEANRAAHPVSYTAGEVAGSILFPLGQAKTLFGNLLAGTAAGAAYSAGTAEGDARGSEAVVGGITGGLTAGALSGLGRGVQRVLRRADERPSAETFNAARKALYRKVDESGIVFDQTELQSLSQSFDAALDDAFFVPGMGGKADQWQQRLSRMATSGRPVSLSRLDDIRSNIWKAYRAAPDEVELLDAVRAIDDAIDAKDGGEILSAARAANKKFRKVELLEDALEKATDRTASAGSGGNIENQFRAAFRRILNSEKQSRFFSDPEKDAMRNFVRGDVPQDVLRRIGKLSPTGNGLMQALNLGAIAYDPTMLAVTGAATGAKMAGDARIQRKAQDVIDLVGGQASLPNALPSMGVPAGVASNSLRQERP